MKNPIEITSLMIFSGIYFTIGVLNWIYKDPVFTYNFFNLLLNNYYVFGVSLAVGLAYSMKKNYQRAKTNPSKILSKTAFLIGVDFIFMLLGVFASQVVMLAFTYSNEYNLILGAGAFGIAVISINICRKPFLDFLAYRIP